MIAEDKPVLVAANGSLWVEMAEDRWYCAVYANGTARRWLPKDAQGAECAHRATVETLFGPLAEVRRQDLESIADHPLASDATVAEPTDLDPCYGNPVERCTNIRHVKRDHEALFAAESDYWQKRHAALAKRVSDAVSALGGLVHIGNPDNVDRPEPPVGTTFTLAESGRIVWERRADGWHCPAIDCRNCPAAWSEVCDHAGGVDDLLRHLPDGDEA